MRANTKTKAADERERAIIGRIQSEIEAARTEQRPINHTTARTMARYLSRGLGGELGRLATTGRIDDHQRARLELFYSTKDETGLVGWHEALRTFITADERRQHGQQKSSRQHRQQRSAANPTPPRHLPPQVNPSPEAAKSDDRPTCSLTYARIGRDEVDPETESPKAALRLHMQLLSCRQHIRRYLHRCLGATYADHSSDEPARHRRHNGLRRLLNHLRAVRDQRRRQVVIERLDRLLGMVGAAQLVVRAGGQVRAASGERLHGHRRSESVEIEPK